MENVKILMSTYNGGKYIREQLDSLVNQTYKNIDVYIRDDGSSDDTVDIVKSYENDSFDGIRFHLIEDEVKKNLGYPDCFWEITRKCGDAKYYSFCDQDDIWLPDKVERAVAMIQQEEAKCGEDVPIMSFTSFDYCNQSMEFVRDNPLYEDMNNNMFAKGLYYTYAPGFTQVINRALFECIDADKLQGKKLAHDIWCQWIASSCGKVLCDKGVFAHYRRHDAAVTDANISNVKLIKRWWKKEIMGEEMVIWKQSLCHYHDMFIDKVDEESAKVLSLFGTKRGGKKLKKLFYPLRLRPTKGGDLSLRILILLGRC